MLTNEESKEVLKKMKAIDEWLESTREMPAERVKAIMYSDDPCWRQQWE